MAASFVGWRVAWRDPEPILPPPSLQSNAPAPPRETPPPSPAPTGTLLVRAPVGATVRVDEQQFVVGPEGVVRTVVASDVDHGLIVSQPHHAPIKDRVRVAPGATAEYRALGHSHGRTLDKLTSPDPGADTPPQKSNNGDYTLDPF
jgi:hypothetical protein